MFLLRDGDISRRSRAGTCRIERCASAAFLFVCSKGRSGADRGQVAAAIVGPSFDSLANADLTRVRSLGCQRPHPASPAPRTVRGRSPSPQEPLTFPLARAAPSEESGLLPRPSAGGGGWVGASLTTQISLRAIPLLPTPPADSLTSLGRSPPRGTGDHCGRLGGGVPRHADLTRMGSLGCRGSGFGLLLLFLLAPALPADGARSGAAVVVAPAAGLPSSAIGLGHGSLRRDRAHRVSISKAQNGTPAPSPTCTARSAGWSWPWNRPWARVLRSTSRRGPR
jgi:hypothetical protein